MNNRAIVGKVDPQGIGLAVYLGHRGEPDAAGPVLLEHYSEPDSIDRLIERGSIAWLAETPEQSVSYHRGYGFCWPRCRPFEFEGGTDQFFRIYWNAMAEWLYVWTPDGWLASPAMPGAPPPSYFERPLVKERMDADPEWQEWLRLTRECQRPLPLQRLITTRPAP